MVDGLKSLANRRLFMKKGLAAAGTASLAAGVFATGSPFLAQDEDKEEGGGTLNKGDAAILRNAAAAVILEADFWTQDNELGGIQDTELPAGSGNPTYTSKLQKP